MKSVQYTIRNIPQPLDRYLRKRAQLNGKSLNETIIAELSVQAGLGAHGIPQELDWFIGSGADLDVMRALAEDDQVQKILVDTEMKYGH